MTRRTGSLAASIVFLLSAWPALALDVNELVRHAAERQRDRELAAGPLGFERVEVETELDASGRPGRSERRRYAVVTLGPAEMRRELLEVDGRPATDAEKDKSRREDEKRHRRRAASGGDTKGAEDELRSGRLPLFDLLGRLDFRLAGEELVDGRPSYLVEFGPKPGLTSRSMRDRVLNSFAGRAWIDVAEREIRRIDGHLTKPLKVLGGAALDLTRVHVVYEGREALPDLWAPCREEIRIEATAGFVIGFNREIRFEFSGYRSERPEPRLQAAR